MDLLLWTALILGFLGAAGMLFTGLGLETGEVVADVEVPEVPEVPDTPEAPHLHDHMPVNPAVLLQHASLTHQVAELDLLHAAELLDKMPAGTGRHPLDPPPQRLSPFSSFSLFGFLGGFGAGGLALRALWPDAATALVLGGGLAIALVLAGILWRFFNWLLGQIESDSMPRERELLGRLAAATMPIPAGAVGEVEYVIRGKRMTAPARNTTGAPLERGAKVRLAARDDTIFQLDALTDRDLDYLAALAGLEAHLEEPAPVLEEPPRQVEG